MKIIEAVFVVADENDADWAAKRIEKAAEVDGLSLLTLEQRDADAEERDLADALGIATFGY